MYLLWYNGILWNMLMHGNVWYEQSRAEQRYSLQLLFTHSSLLLKFSNSEIVVCSDDFRFLWARGYSPLSFKSSSLALSVCHNNLTLQLFMACTSPFLSYRLPIWMGLCFRSCSLWPQISWQVRVLPLPLSLPVSPCLALLFLHLIVNHKF